MYGPKCRKLGALWMIGQGVVTALIPQTSVWFLKQLLGQNFENTAMLEAKPAYIRQLRAVGIGMAAAGIAGYAMEQATATDEETAETDEETPTA